jgi:hypothetical protein
MADFVTIAAVTLFVVVVHTAIAVYLYRSLSDSTSGGARGIREVSPDPSGPSESVDGGDDGNADADPEETVHCPVCGTPNDPQFRFCRRCVSDLSGSTPPQGARKATGPG